jgi:hypothetical protein
LLIADLLNYVKHSEKGLKLDFKDQNTVAASLDLLTNADLEQPIILNADILNLKDAPNAIIDPEYFINTCVVNYSKGLLSLGWRTTPSSRYELEDIDKMLSLTRNLTHVTFPLRASILPQSWEEVKKLLVTKSHTLTIWDSEPVNKELGSWINKNTDKQRCFYDLA